VTHSRELYLIASDPWQEPARRALTGSSVRFRLAWTKSGCPSRRSARLGRRDGVSCRSDTRSRARIDLERLSHGQDSSFPFGRLSFGNFQNGLTAFLQQALFHRRPLRCCSPGGNFDDCLWFHSFSLCDDEKLGSRQENSPDHLRPRDQTDQTGKTRIVDMRQRTHCGSRIKYNLAANEAED
jgi:hypothetical protein